MTRASTRFDRAANLLDTPGVLSLPSHSDDERATMRALLDGPARCLLQLGDAKALAIAARRRVDHNCKRTVGLNTGILAAAALGALSPGTTALLHNGTTIGILLNALRRP